MIKTFWFCEDSVSIINLTYYLLRASSPLGSTRDSLNRKLYWHIIHIFRWTADVEAKDLKTCSNKHTNRAIWHDPWKRGSHVHTSGFELKISQPKFLEFIPSSKNLKDNIRYRSATKIRQLLGEKKIYVPILINFRKQIGFLLGNLF